MSKVSDIPLTEPVIIEDINETNTAITFEYLMYNLETKALETV